MKHHIKFCDLYEKMEQGQQILMLYTSKVLVCEHKSLPFWPNIKR